MKERIKEIRKNLGLTQAAFGERLGVSRDAVNNLELGRVDPSEIVIRAIVRDFKVDYHWLKTGIGEMYLSEDDKFQAAIDDLMTGENEKAKAFLRLIVQFEDHHWNVLDEIQRGDS